MRKTFLALTGVLLISGLFDGLFDILFSSAHDNADDECSRCGQPMRAHIRDGSRRYCPDELDEDDWI